MWGGASLSQEQPYRVRVGLQVDGKVRINGVPVLISGERMFFASLVGILGTYRIRLAWKFWGSPSTPWPWW